MWTTGKRFREYSTRSRYLGRSAPSFSRCTRGLEIPSDRIRLLDPVGYLDFLKLMKHARIVLTDSGGIQEETTVLGIPCLTIRENTERPITIEVGTNVLTGTDKSKIIEEGLRALAGGTGTRKIPELWDGKTSERIAGVIDSFLL
jgi:UDP-N-acetylglucosamine 2-epimerase (non-hydrolysing)